MRRLGALWKAASVLHSARDLTVERREYRWTTAAPNTFFLQAEHAEIRLAPGESGRINAAVELQMGIGWQLATDQDEAGVYVIARRKPVIGGMGRAKFAITLPRGIHISLKLESCRLCLDDCYESLELPPLASTSPP